MTQKHNGAWEPNTPGSYSLIRHMTYDLLLSTSYWNQHASSPACRQMSERSRPTM